MRHRYRYLGGGESYFFGCSGGKSFTWQNPPKSPSDGTRDMWHDDHVGDDIADQIFYSANFYTERAISIIGAHPVDTPLFLYLPYQNVHAPNQAPPDWELINGSSFAAGNTCVPSPS
jgi:arylsulfatase A-like enzyme